MRRLFSLSYPFFQRKLGKKNEEKIVREKFSSTLQKKKLCARLFTQRKLESFFTSKPYVCVKTKWLLLLFFFFFGVKQLLRTLFSVFPAKLQLFTDTLAEFLTDRQISVPEAEVQFFSVLPEETFENFHFTKISTDT